MFDRVFVRAVDHLLADAPWARERLMPHADCVLHVDSVPFEVRARITDEGLLDAADADQVASVRITLPLGEMPAALASGGLAKAFGRARIEGDAELAETLGFVFRNLEWDVEEDLARVVGDIPAHRLADAARALRSGAARGAEALRGNVGEYLSEESGLLATRPQLEAFRGEVATLRDALARLEKRVSRVERKLHR
ncbi:ubiquinone biosynthesis accessory factor UbiJ [Pseudazoarcus pumilus]|uniref:Ubiquinone biosynthesis accessory factor UbiJ n=1 Tax=Pseudazoarcus pumilus TaxID=2067960 RepID=A0A2I6SA98_9RHOO|nr:hypothetical protein [Pseudazoarcus pumilus]AUN96188.1 hypothetical protein C0099_15320 [Pseudazoarcus pumilus]